MKGGGGVEGDGGGYLPQGCPSGPGCSNVG